VVTVRAFLGPGTVDYGSQIADIHPEEQLRISAILVCPYHVPKFT
jgi:hypothetical protein